MTGFRTVGEFGNADLLGQCWFTQFRKNVPSAATATSGWVDYSYFPGSPVANFYASTPAVAALVEADKGIRIPTVAPLQQHLKNLTLMTANSTTNGRQRAILADYLLYYPFIDTDAVGEVQGMTNYPDGSPVAAQLPTRWPKGGKVIAVGQSASATIGTFTFTYTNQDGIGGRISQPMNTYIIAGGGQIVSANNAGTTFNPYCALQAGDSSVISIQDVTFTVGGGGLMALVIVKPLLYAYVTQESRTTTGVAFGAANEFMSVIHSAGAPKLLDGAVLNIIGQGNGGSLATSQLLGLLETVWN
jgi:hypothetical protein